MCFHPWCRGAAWESTCWSLSLCLSLFHELFCLTEEWEERLWRENWQFVGSQLSFCSLLHRCFLGDMIRLLVIIWRRGRSVTALVMAKLMGMVVSGCRQEEEDGRWSATPSAVSTPSRAPTLPSSSSNKSRGKLISEEAILQAVYTIFIYQVWWCPEIAAK